MSVASFTFIRRASDDGLVPQKVQSWDLGSFQNATLESFFGIQGTAVRKTLDAGLTTIGNPWDPVLLTAAHDGFSFVFDSKPAVAAPPQAVEIDVSATFLATFRQQANHVPGVGSLRRVLTNIIQIPVHSGDWNQLQQIFTATEMNRFFIQSNNHCHSFLCSYLWHVLFVPPNGRNEFSYISSLDGIMGTAAKLFGKPIERNTTRNTSTASQRPDWISYERGEGFFRGEEKGDEPADNPEDELYSKLIWKWGTDLNFIFGYSSVSNSIQFHTITKDSVNAIGLQYNLTSQVDRMEAFIVSCNIFRHFNALWNSISHHQQSESILIEKGNHRVEDNRKDNTMIKKHFISQVEAQFIKYKLEMVYHIIQQENVNGTDTKVDLYWQETHTKLNLGYLRLKTSPIGYLKKPNSDGEIKAFLTNILTTLKDLHQSGIIHRDVRWPIIIYDGVKWFLIDFEDCVFTKAAIKRFKIDEKKLPQIRLLTAADRDPLIDENPSRFTDIYSVGHLISEIGNPARFASLVAEMLDKTPEKRPTAIQALQKLSSL